jgi:hypothetical protein
MVSWFQIHHMCKLSAIKPTIYSAPAHYLIIIVSCSIELTVDKNIYLNTINITPSQDHCTDSIEFRNNLRSYLVGLSLFFFILPLIEFLNGLPVTLPFPIIFIINPIRNLPSRILWKQVWI